MPTAEQGALGADVAAGGGIEVRVYDVALAPALPVALALACEAGALPLEPAGADDELDCTEPDSLPLLLPLPLPLGLELALVLAFVSALLVAVAVVAAGEPLHPASASATSAPVSPRGRTPAPYERVRTAGAAGAEVAAEGAML